MPRHTVPISVSNSHVHFCASDLRTIFGTSEAGPTRWRGHAKFEAAAQHVRLVGPRGVLDRVRVLHPPTNETWIELNLTHAFRLGVRPPLESGELPAGENVRVEGPSGSLVVRRNVVIEARHVEITQEEADRLGLSNSQIVRAQIGGARALVFENVAVRVLREARPGFVAVLELDRDEANAAMVSPGDHATLVWG